MRIVLFLYIILSTETVIAELIKLIEEEENTVSVVKMKSGKTSGKSYTVKKENIYKAQPLEKEENRVEEDTHPSVKVIEHCFYCHKGGYVDYHHNKEECDRYLAVAPKETVVGKEVDSYTDEDEWSEQELVREEGNEEDSFYDAEETGDINESAHNSISDENTDENTTESEENVTEHEESKDDENIAEEERKENAEYDREESEDGSGSADDPGEDPDEVPGNNNNLRPPPKPPYTCPIKGDRIMFATAEGFLREATILTKRYRGEWYNVQYDDGTKIGIQLTRNLYWKFCQEDKNDFFTWRWGTSEQGG